MDTCYFLTRWVCVFETKFDAYNFKADFYNQLFVFQLMHERGQIDEEELAMKLNEEVRWEEEGQSPPEGEGMYHYYDRSL